MSNEQVVEMTGVQVRTKLPKTTKTNKPYWILETSRGSMMCFTEAVAAKISVSETAAYTLNVTPPAEGYKSYVVKGVSGVAEVARPAAAPAQAQTSRPPEQKSWGGGTMMTGDLARDTRISKLSVFAAIAQIQAAKIRVNADYATASTAAVLAECITLTEAVLQELIYPVPAQAPANAEIQKEAPWTGGSATYTAPAATPPPAQQSAAMPPATPRPETTQPATPPTPPAPVQTAEDKQAQAKKLFGVKSDLEAKMADRVNKMLSK